MKLIIYFLLICNIGFAAWHFRGGELNLTTTKPDLEVSHESQLVLLSEYKLEQKRFLETPGAKLCYSLGPFTKKIQSSKTQKLLRYNNFETRQISLRDTGQSGYWIILPASSTRKQANKTISRLKKLKVKDFFLVATGPFQNSVSLGVFSSKKTARRRIDEIIRLGFIPQMESVRLPQKLYWLNWDKSSKVQPDESLIDNIKNRYSQISIKERRCK